MKTYRKKFTTAVTKVWDTFLALVAVLVVGATLYLHNYMYQDNYDVYEGNKWSQHTNLESILERNINKKEEK